jgi:tetratricopeptide (TPR) repeat protein
MASALRTFGLVAFLAAAPHLAWASPALSGSYQAEPLGKLELSTQEDGSLVGRMEAGGGACNFSPSEPVLEGRFQDNVLVGKVTLCLEGASCKDKERQTLDLLAFYHPEGQRLVAQVRLPTGCWSPALGPGSLLRLRPVAGKASPGERPTPAPESSPRGAELAPQDKVRALAEFTRGSELLDKQDWGGAEQHFLKSLEFNDANWLTHYSLAIVLMKQNRPKDAERALIQALDKASLLPANTPAEAEKFYMLARAFARVNNRTKTVKSLRQAVDAGYHLPSDMFPDEHLQKLVAEEPEILALAKRARANPPPKKRR